MITKGEVRPAANPPDICLLLGRSVTRLCSAMESPKCTKPRGICKPSCQRHAYPLIDSHKRPCEQCAAWIRREVREQHLPRAEQRQGTEQFPRLASCQISTSASMPPPPLT